jgi:hypothetical protein
VEHGDGGGVVREGSDRKIPVGLEEVEGGTASRAGAENSPAVHGRPMEVMRRTAEGVIQSFGTPPAVQFQDRVKPKVKKIVSEIFFFLLSEILTSQGEMSVIQTVCCDANGNIQRVKAPIPTPNCPPPHVPRRAMEMSEIMDDEVIVESG